METIEIGTSGVTASRIAQSTWAIGGWVWGGNTIYSTGGETRAVASRRGGICDIRDAA